MKDPKECDHNSRLTIEDYIHDSGKATQQLFFVAKCSDCKKILSVIPKDTSEQKFQVIFRDLFDIKQHLADIASKLDK